MKPARTKSLAAISLLSVMLFAATAFAQTDEDVEALDDEFTHDYTHTALASARIVHFPGFILDTWFAKHANHWDGQANMAYGVEYVFRKTGSFDLQAGLYWTDLSMQDAYWLEADKDDDLVAADYTRQGLSTLAAEINFFGYHDFIPEFGIFYGGGLWFGGLLGEIQKANVDEQCAMAAENGSGSLDDCGYDNNFVTESGVPPVAGFVSISTGLRAQFEERFIVKVEAGFKGYFFGGLAMGAQFW